METTLWLLIVYHFLFFWRIYSNPFSVARSELLSTFFTSWVHLGRGEKHDAFFWGNYHSHPVLSTYYPPHFLSSLVGARLGLGRQFVTLLFSVCCHSLFGSIGWYLLILGWSNPYVALFGAITLTYSAYNIKQQPCILYTIGWFPWLLLGIANQNLWLSSLSFGMVLLSGYYPIGIQMVMVAIASSLIWNVSLLWILLGGLIGLPQLIPFLNYLPKTIRTRPPGDKGIIPAWHLLSLFVPKLFRLSKVSGVGYWEMNYYVGIVPLVLLLLYASKSAVWLLGIVSLTLMLGAFRRHLPRIPARWCFSFQFALGWLATVAFNNCCIDSKVWLSLILLQAFDLWLNNSFLTVTSPFSELPKKPSLAFNTRLTRFLEANLGDARVSGLPYPLFTGHVNRLRTLGYSGGMQTKEMAAFRGDTNPDGSGEHDWFQSHTHKDDDRLTRYGVKYAFSRKRLAWPATSVRNLYENPQYSAVHRDQ